MDTLQRCLLISLAACVAALCVGMLEGRTPEEALRRACAAGAYAATVPGAQASPTVEQLEALLK